MAIPDSVTQYLRQRAVPFRELPHAPTETLRQAAETTQTPLGQLARAVLLKGPKRMLMAVLPATHILDFDALCKQLECDLEPVGEDEVGRICQDCELGSVPPLGQAYGIPVILDESLLQTGEVYFEPGSRSSLLAVQPTDFLNLQPNAWRGSFARPVVDLVRPDFDLDDVASQPDGPQQFTPLRIRDRIQEIHDLPPIPEMAHRLLELSLNPLADADDLAHVVQLDPSLAAQVVSYATSPFYGYRGRVDSVRDAITRVLGFDMVMNMGLGIAIGKSLRIPHEGPLGMKAYWRHAIYTAALTERLATSLPREFRIRPGMAYLAGLLHDFGHLLLGHVFKPGFILLNRFISVNPEIPITDLETYVLGVRHDQIGAWLMRSWGMPEELLVAVRWHHHEAYWDQHALYSHLVLVADRLLKRQGIGDAADGTLPAAVLEMLELTEEQALVVLGYVMESCEALDTLVSQMAA
ncbi:MAG: HDOD domain-containing protein [Gammaproteobacteria bacterium]|nr:HDOD domain-containing protein [Gammaproteobacteria bacterium]